MSKRTSFLHISFFAFLAFVIFSYFVHKSLFTSLDFNATLNLQDNLGDFFIGPFSVFSILGTVEIASLFLLLVLYVFKIPKKIFVLIFYVLTTAIELIGKSIIPRIPPPVELLKTDLHVGFPSGSVSADFFSYPSGHLARTTFISGVLLFAIYTSFKNRKRSSRFALPALALAVVGVLSFDILMFVSRIYLGEHWLTDVIGGTLLGFALAIIATNSTLPLKKLRHITNSKF